MSVLRKLLETGLDRRHGAADHCGRLGRTSSTSFVLGGDTVAGRRLARVFEGGSDVSKLKLAVVLAALTLGGALAPGTVYGRDSANQLDTVIVSNARELSAADIRDADITETDLGRAQLEELSRGPEELEKRPRRVFSFGNQLIIVGAATPLKVFAGLNEAGETVHEILPLARPTPLSPRAGFAVPPDSAWVHSANDDWTDVIRQCDGFGNNCQDTWKRQGFWNIQAAWNQGSYQYFRMYGRQTTSTITGTDYPWSKTWFDLDNTGTWGGSPSEFEGSLPEQDYHSAAGTTITIGFKAGINFELGKPPLTVGGSADQSYTGTVTSFHEYWHPIIRAEMSSGGVMYCRYDTAYKQTRKLTARVGIRQNKNAQLGGWYIYRGQQLKTTGCPGPN